jgi:chorismate synthase
VMATDPVDPAELTNSARNEPLTRPRPGHADYAGMLKYGFDDARPVLERASARETAARVAAGTVARSFLRQALGVEVLSHVIAIGPSKPYDGPPPRPEDLPAIDDSPVRAFDKAAEEAMIAEIEAAKKDGDTLGGVVEVVALGLPVGLGSFTSGDNRLDSQLAAAVMGIQAIKGVEIGDGFETARRRGSRAHDEMYPGPDGVVRSTNRAGGLEGGMTNGQPLRVRAAMKPISTVPRALATVDMATGDEAVAIHQRSDVCAVPAAGVVVETMVALVLARAALEKFGGDSLTETRRNVESYLRAVADRESPAARGTA